MSFVAKINAFGAKTQKQMEFFVRTVCMEVTNGVVLKTPVDTGRARANWFPSLNNPNTAALEQFDKSGRKTIGKANAVAKQATGNVFFLTNNLPYIRNLEYGLYGNPKGTANGGKTIGGFSKQAPQGMVRITINEVVRHYS